jgi:hypothetical protein
MSPWGVTFFEQFPVPSPPPRPARRRRNRWEKPEHILPASAPGEAAVIRTPDAAVWVGSIQVYPNGFAFTVRVVRRELPDGSARLGRPFGREYRNPDPFEAEDRNAGLRFGIEYADGRRTAMGQGLPTLFREPRDDRDLWLEQNGGGGSELNWQQDLWLSPLPPDGPVTLVASWPDAGVTEQRGELDGTAIRSAAARAVELWPEAELPDDARSGVRFRTSVARTADDNAEEGDPAS